MNLRFLFVWLCASFALSLCAEPYLAVKSGLSCASCHVNIAGGGQRNTFGASYGLNSLPAAKSEAASALLEKVQGKYLSIGANTRTGIELQDSSDKDDAAEFGVDRTTLYLSAKVNEHVQLYLDQQLAPGGSLNRESWVQLSNAQWHFKAGRIFLPYGWRIEDDQAFIRQATGINFDNPDNGIEIGYRNTVFNSQLSLSNGTAGAGEIDDGKQLTLRAEAMHSLWRMGVSASNNKTDLGTRRIYGVFAALKTGPISWLAEWDNVEDDDFDILDEEQEIVFLEANYEALKGHNLKLTFESLDSDLSGVERRYRYSIIWEYFPFSATQIRFGYRYFESDNEIPAEERDEGFLQLHVYL